MQGSSTFNYGPVVKIPKPARAEPGDFLIAIVVADGSNPQLNASNGSTLLWNTEARFSYSHRAGTSTIWVMSRFIPLIGTEPSEYSFDASLVGPNGIHAVMTAWQGVSAPFPSSGVTFNTATADKVTAPNPTPGWANQDVFVFAAVRPSAIDTLTWTRPSDMTEVANENAIVLFQSANGFKAGTSTKPLLPLGPAQSDSMSGITMMLRGPLVSLGSPQFRSKSEFRISIPAPIPMSNTGQRGDVWLLQLRTDSRAADVVNGTDWNLIRRDTIGTGPDAKVGMWLWRKADLTEAAVPLALKNIGTSGFAGTVLSLSGADQLTPILGSATALAPTAMQWLTFPAVVTSDGGTLVPSVNTVTILGLMSNDTLTTNMTSQATVLADAGSVMTFQATGAPAKAYFSEYRMSLSSTLVIQPPVMVPSTDGGPGLVRDSGVATGDAGIIDPSLDSGTIPQDAGATMADAGAIDPTPDSGPIHQDAGLVADAGSAFVTDGGTVEQPPVPTPDEIRFSGFGCEQGPEGALVLGLMALMRRTKRSERTGQAHSDRSSDGKP